jgi:hypothetical protein
MEFKIGNKVRFNADETSPVLSIVGFKYLDYQYAECYFYCRNRSEFVKVDLPLNCLEIVQ